MNTITVNKKNLDFSEYVKRSALESDFQNLIKEDCLVMEDGQPKILYCKIDDNLTSGIRNAVKSIKYEKGKRTNGLVTESRIFGYSPRNTIRKDYCSSTSLSYESPEFNKTICDFGNHLAELYQIYFPSIYRIHNDLTEKRILQNWKIEGTPFTSGIVNKNNPLKYHFDAGNIKDVLSNMVVFKSGVQGGHLSCPEYDLGFEVSDNTVILFDGQKILHGVTPIKKLTPDSYRYSVVFYTLQQMWNCLPLNEEVARAQKIRTKRETGRANGEIDRSQLAGDKN